MPGNSPLLYWDSCIFIAWLKNEQRPQGEMQGLQNVVHRFHSHEIRIATSVLTMSEVTLANMPAGTEELLDDLMKHPNFARMNVDPKVAKLARSLRDHYIARKLEHDGKGLTTPDSIHLATAILLRVDEFQTFDEADNGSRRSLGLLRLDGNVAGHDLKICKPSVEQLTFGFSD